MSNCEQILLDYFPDIDGFCVSYIEGILTDTSADLESSDDVLEAVGDFLREAGSSESKILEACMALFNTIKPNSNVSNKSKSNGELKILEAPKLMENRHNQEDSNIWLAKPGPATRVDPKKMEKTEAKLKEKQLKRQQAAESVVKKNIVLEGPSASQQTNRRDMKMDASGTNKSYDVRVENFDISFGERSLLQNANLMMARGRRYGLVGRNGIGKTTLLRMLATKQLRIPSHMTVLHVEQEVVGDETAALESVLSCDIKRQDLIAAEKSLVASMQNNTAPPDASERLSEIYAEMERMEADKAPAKAAVIMAGLGFKSEHQKRPTKEFSGGWRMRLSLAQALFAKPDLLLLDEPTNMLDMKAVIWLQEYLQTWPSTILVVSHDRDFLNAVATDIVHLHSQTLDPYKGNFEDYVKAREERLLNQQREYDAQEAYKAEQQLFIDKFRYSANRASQVQSRIKLLEKLPLLKPVVRDPDVVLHFPYVEVLPGPILQLDEVDFHYEKSKPIFKNVDLSPCMNSRICIVGDNGAGKTTLLKVLLGELSPTSGVRHSHRNLRIGYFSQHHVDKLDLNMCPVEIMASKYPGQTSEAYRSKLGNFGISGELALRPLVTLSGGQKSKVAFAVMTLNSPNFLILDEPTNHLDMESIEALGKAIKEYNGGVIIVSHDQRLIKSVCTEMWICSNLSVKSLEGGLDEYRRIVLKELEL